jgi:AhpD family alkylhydroperoxidase
MSLAEQFNTYRTKMNDRIMAQSHKVTNRFFSLDNQTYQDGALDAKTKEMLGLIASYVLRCDDCIRYHLGRCHEAGVTSDEIFDLLSVGNIVGGSICIPHMRRAVEYWDSLNEER